MVIFPGIELILIIKASLMNALARNIALLEPKQTILVIGLRQRTRNADQNSGLRMRGIKIGEIGRSSQKDSDILSFKGPCSGFDIAPLHRDLHRDLFLIVGDL